MKYVCKMCGFEYDPATGDPDSGIAPGTQFKDIPHDWVCPICGASKSDFEPAQAVPPRDEFVFSGKEDDPFMKDCTLTVLDRNKRRNLMLQEAKKHL